MPLRCGFPRRTTICAGSYVFDYGNNIRGEAREAGVEDAFTYPGFVPAYIRPLFCRGIGPFRWAALSGDAEDIAAIDASLRDGSDAIADWPILNALVNTAAGATWVSVHHGGGVGIGNAIHAGMVVVADGSDEMAERLRTLVPTRPRTRG